MATSVLLVLIFASLKVKTPRILSAALLEKNQPATWQITLKSLQ